MMPAEVMAVALTRVRPETAARAAAARALNDIELSNVVLKAEAYDELRDKVDEVGRKKAELDVREKTVAASEAMLDGIHKKLKEHATALGIELDLSPVQPDVDVAALWEQTRGNPQ